MKAGVMSRAGRLKQQMHEFIEVTMSTSPGIVTYQDAVTCFILLKIAEIQEGEHISAVASQFRF